MAFASYVFDGLDDALEHVWQSTAPDADRRKWTLSFWAKTTENVNIDPEELNPYGIGFQSMFFDEEEYFTFFAVSDTWVDPDEEVWPSAFYAGISPVGWELFEDPSFDTKVWHHYVVAFDSTQANEADRIKMYIDGQLVVPVEHECELNALSFFFVEDALFELGRFSEGPWFFAGKLAFLQIVSGQALTPDAFGEESGGVWRHKPYAGSYGAWGLCLDGTGGFNDVSGNGFHFTNVGGVQLDPNDLPPFHEGFASYVFDGIDDVIQHVWSSTATDAERRTLTVSFWTKALSSPPRIALQAISGDETSHFSVVVGIQGPNPTLIIDSDAAFEQVILPVSPESWHHYVIRIDTTQATEADRIRVYVDGTLQSAVAEGTLLDAITAYFLSGGLIEFGAVTDNEIFTNCAFAFIDVVSGQSLGPDEFAFDDNGTWTRKPYKGSYGDWGFSLDGSQGFNDVSGNGYHFTNVGGVQLDPNDLPPHVAAEEGFSAIYLGNTQINAIKLGSDDVKAVYYGGTKIFEKA